MKKSLLFFLLTPLFVSGADPHGDVQVDILVQSDASWNGDTLPAYPTEAPQISVVKIVIPPHTQLQLHKHPSINAGYLISGEITVHAEDGKTQLVKAGDGLIEMVNTWHYGSNDGELPAEIVIVYVGIKGRPLAIIKEAE
jgi:quercetin dioxygenase-like cupin family protein